jgi:transcriptional regulator with XRE-family HTH domain
MNRLTKIRKRIRILRIERGYSQYYLGNQLNISQISYHKLETGKTELKVKTLIKLAKILEVEESYLLGCDKNSIKT